MDLHAIPIKEYLAHNTQQDLANVLGLSQPTVCRMLHSTRDIWIGKRRDGTLYAYEVRTVGKNDKAA